MTKEEGESLGILHKYFLEFQHGERKRICWSKCKSFVFICILLGVFCFLCHFLLDFLHIVSYSHHMGFTLRVKTSFWPCPLTVLTGVCCDTWMDRPRQIKAPFVVPPRCLWWMCLIQFLYLFLRSSGFFGSGPNVHKRSGRMCGSCSCRPHEPERSLEPCVLSAG